MPPAASRRRNQRTRRTPDLLRELKAEEAARVLRRLLEAPWRRGGAFVHLEPDQDLPSHGDPQPLAWSPALPLGRRDSGRRLHPRRALLVGRGFARPGALRHRRPVRLPRGGAALQLTRRPNEPVLAPQATRLAGQLRFWREPSEREHLARHASARSGVPHSQSTPMVS